MSISNSQVLATLFVIAPQFATTDPTQLANLNAMITLIGNQVNAQILACNALMAYALLVAHYLTLQGNQNLGIFNNMHEGQLALAFNVAAEMGALQLTPYGRYYADLISRTVVGSFVTNLPPMFGGVIQNMPVGCGCASGFMPGWGGSGGGCGC